MLVSGLVRARLCVRTSVLCAARLRARVPAQSRVPKRARGARTHCCLSARARVRACVCVYARAEKGVRIRARGARGRGDAAALSAAHSQRSSQNRVGVETGGGNGGGGGGGFRLRVVGFFAVIRVFRLVVFAVVGVGGSGLGGG